MAKLRLQEKKKKTRGYHPKGKELDLQQWAIKRKHEMMDSKHWQRMTDIWDDSEKAWEAYRKGKDPDTWQSDYYVPMTTSVVESTLAELIENLPRPFVLPRNSEDVVQARVMQAVLDYSLDVSGWESSMMDIMRGTVIHGTAIAQEYFLKDKRLVRDIVGLSGKNKKKQRDVISEAREVLEYDDVMTEWVSPWDFLVDENAREMNTGPYKARDCIRRFIMSFDAARDFFSGPVWNHLNNFRFVKDTQGDTNYNQFFSPPEGLKENDVEVIWYWARQPDDLLVVMINDVVIRMGPNIYKHKQLPFSKVTDVERIGKFYGKGEPELLDSIQEEANTLRRMSIDRHHLDIDKMFMADPGQTLDEEDLVARPHGLITGNPELIKPIEYGDIPISVQTTFRAIKDDQIAVTGIDERFQSVQRNPSTATEAAILKESTLKRLKLKLRNFEKKFLPSIGFMRMSNIIQFYSKPKLERVLGDKKSAEFKAEVAKLAREGLLQVEGKQVFKKVFKDIRTEGKELFFDEKGQVNERKKPGIHFFTANPKFFLPRNDAGFDIRWESGPSLPVSKPLMQAKMNEMFDRLSQLALTPESDLDVNKLADELIKANDLMPEDLKKQEAVQEGQVEENRLELAVDLATQENEKVQKGEPIPEFGTPFAPPAHTEVHIEFLRSPAMQGQPQEKLLEFMKHIQGEILAIEQRGGEQGAPGQAQAPGQATNVGPDALGARIEGGNQVPTGQAINQGRQL